MTIKNIEDKGTYCLIIEVRKDCEIKIGAKGLISFKKGFYVYVGSALNSLSKRIDRHLSDKKKKHWHMDYLSLNKNTNIQQVIYINSIDKIECDLSSKINKISSNYIDNFGCSDCNCMSHLYYFDSYAEAENICIESFGKLNHTAKKYIKN